MKGQLHPYQHQVMTVTGPVAPENLGITLTHEHLLIKHHGPEIDLVDESLAIRELTLFAQAGGKTLVEVTNIGIGRDPLALQRIAHATGVNIVMGSGLYKDGWLPPEARQMSVEQLAEQICTEIIEGVGDTGVHAGVIGEIGVSRPITSTEVKALRASAIAQQRTGAAITVHFDIGGEAPEYHNALDILAAEGADLTRVVVDHLIPHPDSMPICEGIVQRGCFIEFDLFGNMVWPLVRDMIKVPADIQAASVVHFIRAGMLPHILLSQDVCSLLSLTANGGHGYAYILRKVIPQFIRSGITQEEIHTLLVDNPRRLLPLTSP